MLLEKNEAIALEGMKRLTQSGNDSYLQMSLVVKGRMSRLYIVTLLI